MTQPFLDMILEKFVKTDTRTNINLLAVLGLCT